MEQNQPQQPHPTSEGQVSFPAPREVGGPKKGGSLKWIIAIIGVVVLVVGGVFFIMNSSGGETSTNDNSGSSLSTFPTPETASTPEPASPTPTPEPVDKSEVKVEVLNGTGTAGDAGLAKELIEGLGYENVEAGNAEEQSETETTVTYSRDLDQVMIDELVSELGKTFSDVKTRKGTVAGDFDIRVVTGAKKSGSSSSDTTTEESTDTTTQATDESL